MVADKDFTIRRLINLRLDADLTPDHAHMGVLMGCQCRGCRLHHRVLYSRGSSLLDQSLHCTLSLGSGQGRLLPFSSVAESTSRIVVCLRRTHTRLVLLQL